ncbi:MAG: hypothetical protein M0R51_14425 [Clostridia bacterium]|jgi:hypothetical protein|nr:hypothetical protein [Clostridia bacterium]
MKKEITFDMIKDAILSCFEKTNNSNDDYQCYNGEWYVPICGCDTLQDIMDTLEYT